MLVATIITLVGVAFGVFALEARTCSLQNRFRGVVFRSDQIKTFFDANLLLGYQVEELAVGLSQRLL